MLNRLMDEIRAGGTLESGRLAGLLNTSPQMVEAMLEHLQRMGFINAYVRCGDGCHGCDLIRDCKIRPAADGLRLWQSSSPE